MKSIFDAQAGPPGKLTCEYAVVGSGAGGSVAAQILAAAGKDVLIIEAGPFKTARDFNQREPEMIAELYEMGGAQTTSDGLVNVVQGKVVGGSTVINGADISPTRSEVFAYWRKHHDLAPWDPAEWKRSEDRVRNNLGVAPIPEPLLNNNNKKLREGAANLNWSGGVFLSNRVGCIGAGFCVLGCSYNAKRSSLVTYVPQSLADGARLLCNARVSTIVPLEKGKGFGLVLHDNRHLSVVAQKVICAAGAVQSPLLLARSDLHGESSALGQNLILQPQLMVAARFDEEIAGHRSIPQAYYVDEFETATEDAGLGGFRLEAAFSGPGLTGVMLPGIGDKHLARMKAFRHYAGCMVLVPDQPSGSVEEYPGGFVRISYEANNTILQTMRKGILAAARVFFAAGAREFMVPAQHRPIVATTLQAVAKEIEHMEFLPGNVQFMSAHPQGTCRAAVSAQRGVCNEWGEHHQVPGLYVFDASLFPSSASSHTMLPVMTAADMLTRRLL